MTHLDTVKQNLGDLPGVATARLGAESLLPGSVAGPDAMAVTSVIVIATVGSLTEFAQETPQP